MPAPRSSAEGEIREAVVTFIREHRPQARIIHEINAVNMYAGRTNRIDVLAVGSAELIAVEIKSAKDKLDRLPDQMAAMENVAHHAIVAYHEKFLVEQKTNEFAAHYERDGEFYMEHPPEVVGWGDHWIFPQRRRAMKPNGFDCQSEWKFPLPPSREPLPSGAIRMLWHAELLEVSRRMGLEFGPRATMADMTRSLLWNCTGEQLTRAICATLRRRECIEADPPIEETEAA